jgi:hypothetical protein
MGVAYAEQFMTAAEFVKWDDGTPTRYELINGRPVARSPWRRRSRNMAW